MLKTSLFEMFALFNVTTFRTDKTVNQVGKAISSEVLIILLYALGKSGNIPWGGFSLFIVCSVYMDDDDTEENYKKKKSPNE